MDLDVAVIGAGYTGLLLTHRLRAAGLAVHAFDEADDVGGTWWWQGFPGARPQVEGYVHQYLDQRRLALDWGWSERFPAGYEVLRYLRFVADRLDLRRSLSLGTRVVSLGYDDGGWTVGLDVGGRGSPETATVDPVRARVVVSCAGSRGTPRADPLPGGMDFAGTVLSTARWPWKGPDLPDLRGLRVGVVGAGESGLALTAALAGTAGHVTVFSGTPRTTVPMVNTMYGWPEREAYRARFDELAATVTATASGLEPEPGHGRVDLDQAHDDGSLRFWARWFGEDAEGAARASEYVRRRMIERLGGDAALVAALVPRGPHPARPGLPVLDPGFADAVRRDDVTVLDTRARPPARLRAEGIELADGAVVALDVVALATGDGGDHPLARIDVRGRGGATLADAWAGGPRSTLGLAVHGFPDLLLTAGPLGPDPAHCAPSTVLQHQVAWIVRTLTDRPSGTTLEPTRAAEDAWCDGSDTPDARRDAAAYRRRLDTETVLGHPSFRRPTAWSGPPSS